MSPSDANDYFPHSEVAPLSGRTHQTFLRSKDLVAGFSTSAGLPNHTRPSKTSTARIRRQRYALTAHTIFDWIAGLSDEELGEIEELEVTAADGTKKKIKIPQRYGSKTQKNSRFAQSNQGVKQRRRVRRSDRAQETADGEKALDQLFNDPQIRDFSRLLSQCSKAQPCPELSK